MTLFTRTMLIAGFALGSTLTGVAELQAGCGGGGYRRPHYPSYSRPIYRPPVYAQPQPVPHGRPVQQPAPAFQQPVQQPGSQPAAPAAPQAAAPTAPQTAPTSQPQAPASTGNDAQMTALQALAGMSGGSQSAQAPPAPARAQTPGIAGNWTARLSNGAVVQLTLQANGSFNWSATNKAGQVSTFQGSYTAAAGSLTLIRSDNNGKLDGIMTQNGSNAFNFKLAGAKDNGLDFVRS
jgi:hypothetical protein